MGRRKKKSIRQEYTEGLRHLAFGESSGDPFFTFGAFGGNAQARLGGGLCSGQQECCEQ